MKQGLIFSGIAVLSACSLLPASHPASDRAATATTGPIAERAPNPAQAERLPERRRVGDLVVHRFSGSFHRTPLVLTEEVKGRDGSSWVVDLTLEDGATSSRFRVRMDDEGRVSSASRLNGEHETPGALAEYQALVDTTVFAADSNDGMLGSERTTCLLGSRELDCEVKSYRVRVKDQAATLKVSESSELPGRDLAGEIVTEDGRVLYRSQIITVEQQKLEPSVSMLR